MRPQNIIRDFSEHQQALAMAKATIEWREFVLRRFFNWLEQCGITKLEDIDHGTMLRYQVYVAHLQNRKGQLYDPRTQNTHIIAVRKLCQYLRLRGDVLADPTQGMAFAKEPKRLPKNILSEKEVSELLEQPDVTTWMGLRDRAILEVLYSTAVRRNELLNLDVDDLNPHDGTMFIRNGKNNRDRVVPCGRMAWKWLMQYLPLREDGPAEKAVFISSRGGRLGKQGLKCIVDKYARLAGIQSRVTPHALRHSCATHMSDNGADIAHLQVLLGHARADTTALYIHVAISRLKRVHARCHPRDAEAP